MVCKNKCRKHHRCFNCIALCNPNSDHADETGGFGLWYLMLLLTIFQLYRGSQFYWWRKPEYLEKTTDLATHTDGWKCQYLIESGKICDNILQSSVYAVVINESTELTIKVLDRNIFLVGPFLKFVLL